MSASICSSSRRMPVRVTRSSTDLNRGVPGASGAIGARGAMGCVQSCEQLLQKYDACAHRLEHRFVVASALRTNATRP